MINKVIIVGRLGAEPESFSAGTRFSVATTEKWKDKNGDRQERTEWHNCTAFGPLGDVCGKYLGKGSLVYIEGRIQTDKYEKDGQTRYATKIIVRDMQMLDARGERPDESSDDDSSIPF